ncbi:TnsA endonuclease N-terminal domain-containing protein [Permianibacter aggregans]|uniref:TnsA endonuclease-like protein n=1 Tax=Permianibacter aggregans TaxID=1510150 RepID=A0A4V3D7S5_9GAMM|nr:TnsA endonuclease N-terminal domain-containing protein [Permianibacter aggregans]TDQ49037.1 TnsA endonuclease-like protein [Permianibacter aggregans]
MSRAIKANHLTVTGVVQNPAFRVTKGVPFESSLERDLIIMAQWHHGVKRITAQPVTIEFKDKLGKDRVYTPDLLVEYCPQPDPSWPQAVLYEVKYRKDLWADWKRLRPKLSAARKWAHERGWHFKIMTEVEIRIPYLDNIMWLRGYRDNHLQSPAVAMIEQFLKVIEEADIETVIAACSRDEKTKAIVLGVLWTMLAQGYLGTDLLEPLRMDSTVWLRRPEYDRKWPR